MLPFFPLQLPSNPLIFKKYLNVRKWSSCIFFIHKFVKMHESLIKYKIYAVWLKYLRLNVCLHTFKLVGFHIDALDYIKLDILIYRVSNNAFHILVVSSRDVTTGATSTTAVAPKFRYNPIPTRGGSRFCPQGRTKIFHVDTSEFKSAPIL